jgi:hypothetical protein
MGNIFVVASSHLADRGKSVNKASQPFKERFLKLFFALQDR